MNYKKLFYQKYVDDCVARNVEPVGYIIFLRTRREMGNEAKKTLREDIARLSLVFEEQKPRRTDVIALFEKSDFLTPCDILFDNYLRSNPVNPVSRRAFGIVMGETFGRKNRWDNRKGYPTTHYYAVPKSAIMTT